MTPPPHAVRAAMFLVPQKERVYCRPLRLSQKKIPGIEDPPKQGLVSLSLSPGHEGRSKPPGHWPPRMCVMRAEGSEERT